MKVSIIVCTYNEEDYIDIALNSVITQAGSEDIEIIIGDDGSNDGTLEIIKKWENNYPNIISSFVMDRKITGEIIPSVRVSNLLKTGISKATGDFICFLAGDDYYSDNHFIEKHINMLMDDKYRECVGCFCSYYKVWDNGNNEVVFPLNKRTTISAPLYWGCYCYSHLSTFVFRNVFRNKSANNELKDYNLIDDIGMVYYFGLYGNYCYLPDPMFCYRQRSGSIMSSNSSIDNKLTNVLLFVDIKNSERRGYSLAAVSRVANSINTINNDKEWQNCKSNEKYMVLSKQINNGKRYHLSDYLIVDSDSLASRYKKIIRGYCYHNAYLFFRVIKKIFY